MSAPMSMEEWQSRMRQQKKKDRANISQATETMRKYRTAELSEEELKLKKMREEENQRKKQAQEQLHNYRLKEQDPSLVKQSPSGRPSMDGLPPVVVPERDDTLERLKESGIVSAKADQLSTQFFAEEMEGGSSGDSTNTTRSVVVPVPVNSTTTTVTTTPLDQSWENVGNMMSETPASRTTASMVEKDWIEVFPGEEKTPDLVRLDVDIEFGIITNQKTPSYEGYIKAFEMILRKFLEEGGPENNNYSISYNPTFMPTVRNTQQDDSYVPTSKRRNVRRVMVDVTIPVFLSTGTDVSGSRSVIIDVMRNAVKDGTFLELSGQKRRSRV